MIPPCTDPSVNFHAAPALCRYTGARCRHRLAERGVAGGHAYLSGSPSSFVYLPLTPRAPVTVRLRTEGELHPNGRSYVYVDRYRGTVLRADDAREAPAAVRLLYMLYPLHIGAVGSTVVRVLYLLLGLAPTALAVTGTLIWYRRWKKKHGRLPPTARDVPTRPADVPALARIEDEGE